MRLRFIPLPVIVALVAGQAVAGERSVTPFELLPPGDIVVPVTIDGQGPFRMLLDTGASRSAVTTAVARLLDSRVVGETTMVTPASRERRPLVLLKRVTLGGSGSSSVVGMQLDDDDLNPTIDGLIGQDILAARVYTIDYTERAIVWHTGADAGLPGTRLDVDLDRGRMLVSLPQRVEGGTTSTAIGTVLRLIPDSGADRLVLFSHAELPHLVTVDVGLLKSGAGTRTVQQVRIDGLDVGAIRLRDQDAALLERTVADEPLGDGLLPLHLFARVTINGPGRYLVVEK